MCKISDYTQREIDYIVQNAHFTGREQQFFDLRSNDCSLDECAEAMILSDSTIDRLSKKVKRKIEQVFEERR